MGRRPRLFAVAVRGCRPRPPSALSGRAVPRCANAGGNGRRVAVGAPGEFGPGLFPRGGAGCRRWWRRAGAGGGGGGGGWGKRGGGRGGKGGGKGERKGAWATGPARGARSN